MKVLINILDDEEIVGEWLQRVFSDPVFDIQVFQNPDKFIDAFTSDTDLIITDLRVPGYDLYKTLTQFKTINHGVYIIVMSGYFDVSICERLFELGVDRIIEKGSSMVWMNKFEKYVNELFPKIYGRAKLLEV